MRRPKLRPSSRLLASERLQRCGFPACRGACCMDGVWMDLEEVQTVLRHADLIRPYLPPEVADPRRWFTDAEEPDPFTPSQRVRKTAVLPRPEHPEGTACVFWRPQDARCALQVAAQAQGWHPWTLKPFYCVLHPLDLDEQGRLTLDEADLLAATPGSCLRRAERPQPLTRLFAEELRYLLGESAYRALVQSGVGRTSRAGTAPRERGLTPRSSR